MKTAIATASISGEFRAKLAAIAQAGFDGIELFEQDFIACDASAREVGAMVRDHGLEIFLFQPFRDFEGLPEPLRARAFARAERKFDLMAALGTNLLGVPSTQHPSALAGLDRAADDLRTLGERAAARGLRVGFSALCYGRHISDHRAAWDLVRAVDHPAVGLILNSFHSLARGTAPDSIRAIPGDRIFHVQLADAPRVAMDLRTLARHFRLMPGEGDLDVTGFTRAVLATGYGGSLSLEVINDQLRAGLPRLVALDGQRALLHLLEQVRRTEPALAAGLPAFPPAAPVQAVEFIEFATSPDEAPALETLLAACGFARAGAHVSKAVTLWRQGGINLLLNCENEGFAHTAYVVHGTTVSEIALVVPDAATAHARALALRAAPHAEPTAAGELHIPAIRDIGGTMLRFLDHGRDLGRIWQVDFRLQPGRVAGAGLTAIDHIGQTVAYDEMPSWSLFYAAIFEATKAAMVDVVDPGGLVHSQALQSGALRITLNGADTRRTLAGQFIADSFGASVQHIAFACDDILACAAALAARGFPALPISPNYFDDIAARFGLDPALVARLRVANILYDQDDTGGSFFQLYSLSRPDGLFFEVVERRGGYGGYGAANAPYRIAAQRRFARPAGMPRL